MKQLRRPTKTDLLVNLFDEIGVELSVGEVCSKTGIKNYNTLRALCTYIRNAKHFPEENKVDIRLKQGLCVRVK